MTQSRMWSSVRVLRRLLNCSNERNPCPVFYMSQGTARDNWEEGEDDAKSAWPFDVLGRTRGTMAGTMRLPSRKAEINRIKTGLSSD